MDEGQTVIWSTVRHCFTLSRQKLDGFLNVLWMEVWFHLSCKTDATRKGATNFSWTQQSHPESGCYWNSSKTWDCHAVSALPQHASKAASRYHASEVTEYIHGISDCNETEKVPGQWLSTKHIALPVGMVFPRAAMMETAMNGCRNSGLWCVERFVLWMMILLLPWSLFNLGQSN
jgi:hypothetical protein